METSAAEPTAEASIEADPEVQMPSPFPGMDPYLEAAEHWSLFQHTFVACAHEILWQHQGRLHGRDKEHWYKAVEQLRRPIELE